MLLTPTELERLTIYVAAELARKRRAKGLALNHPEAVAYISDEILEGAREGRSVADLISFGSTLLSTDDVMPGVADLMPMIQVEGTFPDGTKLVTVHDPIRPGKLAQAADRIRELESRGGTSMSSVREAAERAEDLGWEVRRLEDRLALTVVHAPQEYPRSGVPPVAPSRRRGRALRWLAAHRGSGSRAGGRRAGWRSAAAGRRRRGGTSGTTACRAR